MIKYLPDQKPAAIRLDRTRVLLLMKALRDYVPILTRTAPAHLRILRAFALALPRSLPYEVRIYASEWALLSPALRPQGSSPRAGSEAARMYALYRQLRPQCRFLSANMVEQERKRARQRRARVWRGEFDRARDPGAPRIPRR